MSNNQRFLWLFVIYPTSTAHLQIICLINVGDPGPTLAGKILWRRNWQPTRYLPGKCVTEGAWWAIVRGLQEAWPKWLSIMTSKDRSSTSTVFYFKFTLNNFNKHTYIHISICVYFSPSSWNYIKMFKTPHMIRY